MTDDFTLSAEIVDEALDNVRAEIRPYPAYSGRGMYGDTCFGIVSHDARGLLDFVLCVFDAIAACTDPAEIEDAVSTFREVAPRVSTDSLGTDTIWYWPDLSVADPENLAERS